MSENQREFSTETKMKKSVPIHVHISTVFVSLFLLIAIISGWYNYSKTSEILMVAAENTVQALSVRCSAADDDRLSPSARYRGGVIALRDSQCAHAATAT